MAQFHDDKLWQQAYVASLDVLNETAPMAGNDVADQIRKHAMMVLTVVAQAVTNKDRKMRDIKLRDVGSIIVALRSLLSVLWGQEALSDEQFNALDETYEQLANTLPR